MWLSGLHIPESYLTALVQATCRKNGWPLDKSTLYTSVTQWQSADDVTERAHQGNPGFSLFPMNINNINVLDFHWIHGEHFIKQHWFWFAGCFIDGLYLEGAAWDRENCCLIRQSPKQLIQDLPVMKVIPIEAHRLKLQNTFRTPVYVTSERRNAMGVGLVFEADLATTEHLSHWVLQGVCLILNTD